MVGDLSSQEQITTLSQDLLKTVVEAVLNGEMDEHLGYEIHHPSGHHTGNNRNGYYPKTLKSSHGEMEVIVPRVRNGDFEPQSSTPIPPASMPRSSLFSYISFRNL